LHKTAFQFKPVPPFRLDLTVWLLRRRPHNLVDRWDGRTYRRVLVVPDQVVKVAVTQTGPAESPLLLVEASHPLPHGNLTAILTSRLTRMLGMNADLAPFYRLAESDNRLGPLVRRFRGFKPPRFPSVFEALVNAIACQQLTLTLGIHLLNRLATAYGPVFPAADESHHAFPGPMDLAGLEPEAFRSLGFSHSKGRAIIAIARSLPTGSQDLEDLEKLEEAEALARLLVYKGVGRWTAEYVLLRGLGHWAVFPGDDVGARHHLEKWLQPEEPLNYEGSRRLLARWHPYGGLIYFHLLLSGLAEAGNLSG
jgi:DNA-3-methyladenine glycosylase II